ncbi:lytic transglycosylase domain-containing protein [Hyalangium versicolor]|uniref:lytic transglycosylase domain-containing protein n=1 Tax=Hyalangium versicolor TaxID=2861190 RepID=UPI001CCC2EEB|nr:lytic transglycosylase domain-containing protein [Hyalangium versicolor]
MARKRISGGLPIPGWVWLGLAVLTPLVLINLAVSFFGDTEVSPFSLSFLEQKVHALGAYAQHRPACLLSGHEPLEPLIAQAERRHRLPTGLLQALVQVESETHPHRISAAGAMGPGQLMPGTARMLSVEDPFEPEPAIDASARYLAAQLARFDNVRLAVAAYNAGPGAVNGQVPHNGETEFYVAKVMAAYERLRPPPPRPAVAGKSRPTASARPPARPPPATAAKARPEPQARR